MKVGFLNYTYKWACFENVTSNKFYKISIARAGNIELFSATSLPSWSPQVVAQQRSSLPSQLPLGLLTAAYELLFGSYQMEAANGNLGLFLSIT
ncbi:MAG: hypothetical protein ACKVOM_03065 [Ferruginibacter sp.]